MAFVLNLESVPYSNSQHVGHGSNPHHIGHGSNGNSFVADRHANCCDATFVLLLQAATVRYPLRPHNSVDCSNMVAPIPTLPSQRPQRLFELPTFQMQAVPFTPRSINCKENTRQPLLHLYYSIFSYSSSNGRQRPHRQASRTSRKCTTSHLTVSYSSLISNPP